MLFAIGFIFTFVNGGLTGPVPRQRHDRPAAVGHDVRRRALPHGHGDRADPRRVRRDLPLVPEDHRTHARRHVRQDPLLDHLRRQLRDLLPDALPRVHGRAAALLRDRGHELHPAVGAIAQRRDHHRRAGRRRGADPVPLQPDRQLLQGPALGPQSVERDDARMADARDAARCTATSARNCRSCTAGRTTTACRASSSTSFRRTCRPSEVAAGKWVSSLQPGSGSA